MPLPFAFLHKPDEQLRRDLAGLPETVVAAALRLRESERIEDLEAMLPGIIAYHLPPGAAALPDPLPLGHRLREDMGLDSLALSEMAFKFDEVFVVPMESHEMSGVLTVEDLRDFVVRKLGLELHVA